MIAYSKFFYTPPYKQTSMIKIINKLFVPQPSKLGAIFVNADNLNRFHYNFYNIIKKCGMKNFKTAFFIPQSKNQKAQDNPIIAL